jgi:hypothetical protein
MDIKKLFSNKYIVLSGRILIFFIVSLGVAFFVRDVIGINSSFGKLITLNLILLTLSVQIVFVQYFKKPKGERSFAAAFRHTLCVLLGLKKNNK